MFLLFFFGRKQKKRGKKSTLVPSVISGETGETMPREAWDNEEATSNTLSASGVAGVARRSAPPTAQSKFCSAALAEGDVRRPEGPTTHIFVYDLDTNIPAADLEQGLLGLFSVFGAVIRVSCLPGFLVPSPLTGLS
jgi:hypothetical protein